MAYISNTGVLSGPIQLNGNTTEENGKVWLLTKKINNDIAILCYDKPSYDPEAPNYFPIYASIPLSLPVGSSSSAEWTKYDNAVATIGWVRTNFTSSTGVAGFNPDDYVKKETYNVLKSTVDSNTIRIKTLEETVLQIDPLKNRITILENNFNSYKNNPYPDGVIFVAGTAAEVV